MLENSKKNMNVVLGSAIVAKAAVRRENGRIEFLVVFQESTRHEFYWIFSAKKPRSPRRSWKYTSAQGRDNQADYKAHRDFGSFVADYARLHRAEVLTVRVYHARRMASMLTKTAHETIHADWNPQDMNNLSTKLLDQKFQGKLKGGEWWRQG